MARYKPRKEVIGVDPCGILFHHGDVLLWNEEGLGILHTPDHPPPPVEPSKGPSEVVECKTTWLARSQGDGAKLLCVRPHPMSVRHLCALWSGGRLDLYNTEAPSCVI